MHKNKAIISIVLVFEHTFAHANTIGPFNNKFDEFLFQFFILSFFYVPIFALLYLFIKAMLSSPDSQKLKNFSKAKEHLKNPIPIETYCDKYEKIEEDVLKKIHSGELQSYKVSGLIYIDDENNNP